jgi:hypothetical protein
MKINANASGTRTIEVTEEQLLIIKKYSLLESVKSSLGTVDEESLTKLRLTLRSLIASQEMNSRDLLDICPIFYDENMKALGLTNLITLYNNWLQSEAEKQQEENSDNA